MTALPPAVHERARRQHGMISSDQFAELGVSPRRTRQLVTSEVIVQVHHNVFRFAAAPDSFLGRCAAACLADPSVVISGVSAGQMYNLRRLPPWRFGPIHVMTLCRYLELDGVIVHRTNSLDPDHDVVHRPDGIRVLAVPRLAFDLARFLDDADFESVVEQLLDRKATNIPRLMATGRRLSKSGRDGTRRFARVLGRRPAWMKPKRSDLEVQVLGALREAGIELVPGFRVQLPDGSFVHLDGADPVRRFGVEVDHVTWHGGRVDSQYDKWRDRQLARVGWYAPRVPDEELRRDFHATIQELVELHRERRVA